MTELLTGAFWLARFAGLRANVAGWFAGNAVRAVGIGLAALTLIVLGALGWHALFGPAPVHKQTAEEVVIDVQRENNKALGEVLQRAQEAERATSFARDAEQAKEYDGAGTTRAVEVALQKRPGGGLVIFDERTLELLRKP